MAAFKDKNNNSWRAVFYYKDFEGNRKQKNKRGFKTKREALEWEREFLNKISNSPDMTFQSLYETYIEDVSKRLKESTLLRKKCIIKNKILPYFSKKKLKDITILDIRRWQNELLTSTTIYKNKKFSDTSLRQFNVQLSAVFSYAKKYFGINNPCEYVKLIGNPKTKEMNIWELEDFAKFIEEMENDEITPCQQCVILGFKILFWTGLRIGELLALTFSDVDLDKKIIKITKNYQRLQKRDYITKPKTDKSIRQIEIPDDLAYSIKSYKEKIYKPDENTRIFNVINATFIYYMNKYSKKAGIKRIRIHDLRHSHASFLFNNDVDILTISKRLGHEDIKTTLSIYTHLYKKSNTKLLNLLNDNKMAIKK